ncbi:ligase-associated DNA damage response endonuclease PdeM [Roseicyclus sp. F158]|uniref:Ligase-associated DNA damage response endonuclease PdeM n=1 Tax=Tropicimonas omnivorans TaxID=3075590 RepID=A0ABU3DG36_9RHOB|nr:ligase-associated DNA damage response endonuclease PdeM [Roseicyclus sp. F158]MDT0682659.1 ligase-associated DNA damage response endonuclease PdeM [Roseicyclus sp. F158]
MNAHGIDFAGSALTLLSSGLLWWEAERTLCASDLHLGKSERHARRGGSLLPPYETGDTLQRLDAAITALGPARVICLGDSFDDAAALGGLAEEERLWLLRLMAGRDWVWIEGNHDPGPLDVDGRHLAELTLGPLTFRHIAEDGASPGEISGHWHPKIAVNARGSRVARPCFVTDGSRLIMPAFGTYTGGLFADAPPVGRLMERSRTLAILTGEPMARLPVFSMPKGKRPGAMRAPPRLRRRA